MVSNVKFQCKNDRILLTWNAELPWGQCLRVSGSPWWPPLCRGAPACRSLRAAWEEEEYPVGSLWWWLTCLSRPQSRAPAGPWPGPRGTSPCRARPRSAWWRWSQSPPGRGQTGSPWDRGEYFLLYVSSHNHSILRKNIDPALRLSRPFWP